MEEFGTDGSAYGFIGVLIYSFHMPAFVFISGYFTYGHTENKCKILQNTIVPFFIFNTLFELIIGKTIKINILTPQYIFWYLLALFVWRLTIEYLSKIRGLITLSILFSLYVGCINAADRFLAIQRAFAFFPYFVLGYIVSEKKLKKKIDNVPLWLSVSIFIILEILAVGSYLTGWAPVKTWENIQSYESSGISMPQGMLIRLLSILIGAGITIALVRLSSHRDGIIAKIGRRTDCIYVLSGFGVKFLYAFVRRIFPMQTVSIPEGVMISAMLAGVIVFFLSWNKVVDVYRKFIKFCGKMVLIP